MSDEDVGEPELPLQVEQQVDYLRLHGDVERRHRLVADENFGPNGERSCDADPLSLSAREQVGVPPSRSRIESDELHELGEPAASVRLLHQAIMDLPPLRDDLPGGHTGIERRVRVLEDDLDCAPQGLQVGAAAAVDVTAAKTDAALRRLFEPDEQAGQCRLAATRLADDRERFPPMQLEADTVDGLDSCSPATVWREVLDDSVDLQQGRTGTPLVALSH